MDEKCESTDPSTKVIHADCMDVLPTLGDNTVDCVITDPPYFLDGMDDGWSTKTLEKRKSNSHVKNLPMGMKFDRRQGDKLETFMERVSRELFRVLKPGGFLLCFSAPRLSHRLFSGIDKAGFEIRDAIVWTFDQAQVKAFRQDAIIEKDKEMTREQKQALKHALRNYRTPQLRAKFELVCVAMKPVENRFIDNVRTYGTGLMHVDPDRPFPDNVIRVPKPSKEEKRGNTHPTVKPVALIERLMDLFCPEKGLVLDPFAGSFTTGVAARRTSRRFIGCELNREYVDIGKCRLGSTICR